MTAELFVFSLFDDSFSMQANKNNDAIFDDPPSETQPVSPVAGGLMSTAVPIVRSPAEVMEAMGHRLSQAIHDMEKIITESAEASAPLLQRLADVKQVRDVLLGRISPPPSPQPDTPQHEAKHEGQIAVEDK